MIKICVVEDENSIAEMVCLNLELEGYHVTHFDHGLVAKNAFQNKFEFDLIILDVMLPGVNGVDLCKEIRKTSKTPILFLSAKGTTTDRIEGLKAGGNDYLPKPFDLEELLLRVAVLTSNLKTDDIEEIVIGDFCVNLKTFEVKNLIADETIDISKREIALIQLFHEKNNEVIPRSEILDRVWGKDQFPTSRTIDNYILNFRKIFEKDPKDPQFFHSIRGVGYKFTGDVKND